MWLSVDEEMVLSFTLHVHGDLWKVAKNRHALTIKQAVFEHMKRQPCDEGVNANLKLRGKAHSFETLVRFIPST